MGPKKLALITGGSSGLGLAMARALAPTCSHLVLVARDRGRLARAAASLADAPAEVLACSADVTVPADLESVAAELRARSLSIDFLALNAGVAHVKALLDHEDLAELKTELDVNLWGTVLSARVFLPLLGAGARVLLVSSAAGLVGGAGYGTYCASKAGMIAFGESLRRELLASGVSVHVACPADIDTPQLAAEWAGMPAWMDGIERVRPRTAALSADEAARRILRRCRGGRFLIVTDRDIHLLLLAARVLPRRLKDALLDRLFPRPPARRCAIDATRESVAGSTVARRVDHRAHHRAPFGARADRSRR